MAKNTYDTENVPSPNFMFKYLCTFDIKRTDIARMLTAPGTNIILLENLAEIYYFAELLTEFITDKQIGIFFNHPLETFQNKTPMELIQYGRLGDLYDFLENKGILS